MSKFTWATVQLNYREFIFGIVTAHCRTWLKREIHAISFEHFNTTKARCGFIYEGILISYVEEITKEIVRFSLPFSKDHVELNPELSTRYAKYLFVSKRFERDSIYMRHYIGELASYAANARELAALLPKHIRQICFGDLQIDINEEERINNPCYNAEYERLLTRYIGFKLIFN